MCDVNRLVFDNDKILISQQTQVGHLVNSKKFQNIPVTSDTVTRILIP